MSQSGFIAAALLAGFVLFVAARGRLKAYADVLFGPAPGLGPFAGIPVASVGKQGGGSGGGGGLGLPGAGGGSGQIGATDAAGNPLSSIESLMSDALAISDIAVMFA